MRYQNRNNLTTHTTLILIIIAGLLAPVAQAGRVVWDASHGPLGDNDIESSYSQIAVLLRANGYSVVQNDDPIVEHGLWDADILVVSILSNFQRAFQDDEILRIVRFVAAGGGLIVLSDNSQVRPDNLDALLDAFGMSAALGDDIVDLTRFTDHAITEGLESIALNAGGAVGVDEDGQVLASDSTGLDGMVLTEAGEGAVLLIGDADVWLNERIGQQSNQRLALNAFRYLDRDAEGRIEVTDGSIDAYLLTNEVEEHELTIRNTGEGALEFEARLVDDVDWATVEPGWMILSAGEETDVTVTINAGDIEPGAVLQTILEINHNDPDAEIVQRSVTLHVLPAEPVHFDVPEPTGYNHSLLVRSITIDGAEPRPGFEIGVFTENGLCGGGTVFHDQPFGFPAFGDDPFTDEIEGFHENERFTFRIYLPWIDAEIGAGSEYLRGDDHYHTDGLSVLELDGRDTSTLDLRLNHRWNLVSLNLAPPSLDFAEILEPLVAGGILEFVKDGAGRFWDLQSGFSNLATWNLSRGYYIRVRHPATLTVSGVVLEDPHMPVRLNYGWTIIPYLLQAPIPVDTAVASIESSLIFLKRDDGSFYAPEWNWDGIVALEPGEAYMANLRSVDTLVYPEYEGEEMAAAAVGSRSSTAVSPFNMSLLLTGLGAGESVRVIGELGAVIGSGMAETDGRTGIPVWGDDPLTANREGAAEGEYITIQQQHGPSWINIEPAWIVGQSEYETNAFAVGELKDTPPLLVSFRANLHPNPFNNRITIALSGQVEDGVEIEMFDVSGRLMDDSVPVHHIGTETRFSIDTAGLPTGIILLRVKRSSDGAILTTMKALHLP